MTPLLISHVQATLNCSLKHGLQVWVRSGGHDYECLSYVSPVPFVLDLINLRNIFGDIENSFAGLNLVQLWVKCTIGLPIRVELLAFQLDFAILWVLVDTSVGEGMAQ